MPPVMRAAFFEAYRTMTVRETPIPQPGPGEARLRIRYCGICGSDVSLYKTGILSGPDTILGHEISAVVEEDRTGGWEPGTRVVPYPTKGCGECLWCTEGKPRYCLNPLLSWGGFAEFACFPAEYLIVIPDELDDRAAAAAEPFGVALRAVEIAEARPGDLAFVLGLGSIGLFAVAGLAAAGCRVIGADIREDRRAMGLGMGCEEVFDPAAEDPFWKMLSYDLHGPRLAFECSGAPEALQAVINACGHEGVIAILGIPFEPAMVIPAVLSVKEQHAFSISGPSMSSMQRALELLQERPHIAKIITGTVPLDSTGEAIERLVAGDGGIKVLVEPGA
jgi:threonine dehydrogenase-like Zn-dependent dehydrogenase